MTPHSHDPQEQSVAVAKLRATLNYFHLTQCPMPLSVSGIDLVLMSMYHHTFMITICEVVV